MFTNIHIDAAHARKVFEGAHRVTAVATMSSARIAVHLTAAALGAPDFHLQSIGTRGNGIRLRTTCVVERRILFSDAFSHGFHIISGVVIQHRSCQCCSGGHKIGA